MTLLAHKCKGIGIKFAEIKQLVERQPFRGFGVRLSNSAEYSFNRPRELVLPETIILSFSLVRAGLGESYRQIVGALRNGGQGTIIGALITTIVFNGCTKVGFSNWVPEIAKGGDHHSGSDAGQTVAPAADVGWAARTIFS